MMTNIIEITVENALPPYDKQVIITHDDGSTTTMTKETYDAQQAQNGVAQ